MDPRGPEAGPQRARVSNALHHLPWPSRAPQESSCIVGFVCGHAMRGMERLFGD